jgi:hypothetical protein
MKIEIEDRGEFIFVKVSVTPLKGKDRKVQKKKVFHEDILNYLKIQNIKVGRCRSRPLLVTNKLDSEQLSGEWIFEKEKPPAPKKALSVNKRITPVKKKTRRTRKKPKKVEKVLDKSPEDVIIEVEKKETLISSKTQSVTEE